jgi:hypothetical protein
MAGIRAINNPSTPASARGPRNSIRSRRVSLVKGNLGFPLRAVASVNNSVDHFSARDYDIFAVAQ